MSAKEKFVRLWGASADTRDYVIETAWAALPGLLFTAAFALLIPLLCNPRAQDARSPTAGPASTITATTTSVVVSTAKPSSWARPRPSPAGGMDLVPLDDDASDEWLFSARKPAISFTPRAQTDILVRVPDDVKQNWLAKDCLAVTAVRDSRQIETSSHPVDEGILLRFPRKEAHGVINLSLEATCRPRLQRLVKVHFGKGVMEEALEMTKNLAHDLTGLVPAAAQEAERRLEDARRSLGAVSDSVGNSVVFVSDNLLNKLGSAVAGARQSLEGARPEALGRVRDRVRDRVKGAADDISGKLDTVSGQAAEQVRRVQSRLQLALLDAQISANMWWLGATGRREAHDDYQRKAKEFVAKKHSAAKEAVRARRPQPEPVETAPRLWPRMRRPGRCQEKTRRAHKANTHECKAAT
ncbi:hypothetical protein CDD83_3827 [Cordyceps sp. RAO-2017]|nr:hypothetical protein CDD83_3827 [Cordyceps sp. RAO-2017]